jgi:small subunit ribosomal protein S6
MQRSYELMYVLNTRLDEEAQTTLNTKISDTIKKIGGTIDGTEVFGRRRLAYPIQKQTEGLYMITNFQADSKSLKDLNYMMNITEGLLRHLVIRRDEE